MARKQKQQSDDGPTGPGEWIVTFSDCMTLLLCFFVLLLTFSSFDEVDLQKLAGAFDYDSYDSIFPVPRLIKDSVVPQVDRPIDLADEGSEAPTTEHGDPLAPPKKLPLITDSSAYKDRKIIYIPSERMFWGKGVALRPNGQGYLEQIASFLHAIPCRVVVSETGPAPAAGGEVGARLDRAWAIVEFLTRRTEVPASRFNIAASTAPAPARLRGTRVVKITLMPPKVY